MAWKGVTCQGLRSQDYSRFAPGLYNLHCGTVEKVTYVSSIAFPMSFSSKIQLLGILGISKFTTALWRRIYLYIFRYNETIG